VHKPTASSPRSFTVGVTARIADELSDGASRSPPTNHVSRSPGASAIGDRTRACTGRMTPRRRHETETRRASCIARRSAARARVDGSGDRVGCKNSVFPANRVKRALRNEFSHPRASFLLGCARARHPSHAARFGSTMRQTALLRAPLEHDWNNRAPPSGPDCTRRDHRGGVGAPGREASAFYAKRGGPAVASPPRAAPTSITHPS
jgi:hypothetical protein